MIAFWAWCSLALLVVASDAQQLDGPIIMSPKEILLQKGDNYTIHCKGRIRQLEFKVQEGGEEDLGSFTMIQRNVAPSDNDYPYEVALDLYNVNQFAVGFYACHDGLIEKSEIFNEMLAEPADSEHISYTYVYVNDSAHLIAPMREIVFVTKPGSKTVIECKPTFPDIQVNLSMLEESNRSKKSDIVKVNKIGFILKKVRKPCTLKCEARRDTNMASKTFRIKYRTTAPSDTVKPTIFPRRKYFLRNEQIVLNCTVPYKANTAIELNWIIPRDLNDAQVAVISNENIILDAPLLYKTITITNATINDNGTYTCQARKPTHASKSEPTSDSIKIKYLETPFLNLNVIGAAEATATSTVFRIGYVLEAYPPATYKYFKNGDTPILNSTKYRFINMGAYPTLEITGVNIDDMGNYTMEATNANGTKRVTKRLNVQDVPRITFDLSQGRKLKGQIVTLICKVTGYPLPDVTWTFIDDETNSEANHTGKLGIESEYKVNSTLKMKVEKSGIIFCKASNIFKNGTPTNQNQARHFLVNEIEGGFGIENVDKTFIEVSEGKSLSLRCLASIYDFTDVYWQTPNDYDISKAEIKSNTSMSLIATLQISELSLSQTGNYTCIGYYTNGTQQENTIFIDVSAKRPPQIRIPDQHSIQEVIPFQEVVTLVCVAEAIPPPKITWYKDGYMVESDKVKTLSLNYSTVNSTYTFKQNATESVDYECVARSDGYEDRRSYVVTVKMLKEALEAKYIGIIGVIILALLLLILYLAWKIKKEKQFRKELAAAGLLYFKEGAPKSLNPELGIDEQAELLPYDDKFEFPVEKLILGPQLGAGAFGVVYKAEARGIINAEDSTTVAVKMVKKTADNIYIKALASELKIMVHLGKHINIVNLLGACTKNVGKRELIVIVEFCKFGNIHNYMQRHRDVFIDQLTDNKEKNQGNVNRGFSCSGADSSMTSDCLNTNQTQQTDHTFLNTVNSNRSGRLDKQKPQLESEKVSESGYVQPNWRSNYESDYVYEGRKPRPLTSRDLLAWAFQIARGMEYLSSMKILHGDLAARNILLAEDNVVKICDFGLARSIYKNDEYQKKENSPLPVKWLAIECMTDRIFSTQSDVWSFGIVLWELFSLAKTPYPEISPRDLLQRLQAGHRLCKPTYADDRLYDVMRSCWEARPQKRPSFTELQETLGSFLEDNVRNHYVELNQPCAEKNADRDGENYLVQVCAPDYNNQVTPSPHHYANDATGFFFGVNPTPATAQLQHDDEGYLAMTPASTQNIFSPRTGTAFDFDARKLNGRGSAASQGSELTPMLTLSRLRARSGSESDPDHDEGHAPYLNMHPRIDEETDEVFESETKNNNLKNTQNAVTNPTYITFPSIDEKKPITNSYVNFNGNGLVK